MITISNAGQDVIETNYWDTPHARNGLFFGSWNAGALRLLVPDTQVAAIAEMLTGQLCIVTRGNLDGTPALELMWDDGSDEPYCIHLDMRQTDRNVGADRGPVVVSAWTRAGKAAEWPARYRTARTLPYLQPWVER